MSDIYEKMSFNEILDDFEESSPEFKVGLRILFTKVEKDMNSMQKTIDWLVQGMP